MKVLDLFSAAAGGWSLGMHRAGFRTIAACELIDWRRALYAENNPGVRLYEDVRTLTADRLLADLGILPSIVVGSPPCQDISSANTKGKGVEGERSGLYFEAVRIIGEVRPRWFALENSANLRTRGADAVLAALEALGYTCWPVVVRAGDIGANHERPRCWLLGCDVEQVTDPDGDGWSAERSGWRSGLDLPDASDPDRRSQDEHTQGLGYEGGRAWGHRPDGHGSSPAASGLRDAAHANQAGQAHGFVEPGLQQAEVANDGCRDERRADVVDPDGQGQPDSAEHGEMGGRTSIGEPAPEPWADWNGGLAHHLRLDDGISAWVAGTRIAVGGPKGTAAASLIVEAFGDAVVPQIPEAIGRAILRTETALRSLFERAAA